MNTQYILELWLKDVPEYSVEFVQVMLAVGLINTIQNPTMTALHATGDIKKTQIIESSMLLSVVPIAYLCLKFLHISPVMVFLVYFIVELITQFVRVFLIYPKIKLPVSHYFTKVLWPLAKVTALSFGSCYLIRNTLSVQSFIMLCVTSIIFIIVIAIVVYIFGIFKSERDFVNKYLTKLIKR